VFAGGAGFGDPRRRAPASVADDVANGRIGRAAARDIYGTVLADPETPIADAAE
jgi:N-methylhydantoinase B